MAFKKVTYMLVGLALFMTAIKPFDSKAQAAKPNEFIVIGNTVDIKSASSKHIQSIFRGKYSTWNNRQSVVIVLPSKKNETCAGVASYLYETSITGMQKFWLSQVFQGRSTPPVFLDTDAEIINYVKKNQGAIGIISRSNTQIETALIINILN